MNRGFAVSAAVLAGLVFLSIAAESGAQPGGPGPGARGPKAASGRLYNPATVETVRGEIVRVDRVPGRGRGQGHGVHVLLKTDAGEIAVHLGPASYVDKQPLKLAPKDQIEVRGSRVTFEGAPAIIAAQVTRGGEVLRLRDENGVPAWGGRGRGAP